MASSHTKPSANALAPLLKPQADAIQAIIEAKDKLGRGKEGREWGACLSTVGEGVSAWGWVQVVSINLWAILSAQLDNLLTRSRRRPLLLRR